MPLDKPNPCSKLAHYRFISSSCGGEGVQFQHNHRQGVDNLLAEPTVDYFYFFWNGCSALARQFFLQFGLVAKPASNKSRSAGGLCTRWVSGYMWSRPQAESVARQTCRVARQTCRHLNVSSTDGSTCTLKINTGGTGDASSDACGCAAPDGRELGKSKKWQQAYSHMLTGKVRRDLELQVAI